MENWSSIRANVLATFCPNCTILFVDKSDPNPTFTLATVLVSKFTNLYEFTQSTYIDSLHFVTCFPATKHTFLSFLGYVSAFDLYTWLMLLLSMVLTVTIYTVALDIDHLKITSRWAYSTGAMYAILLRQGISDANRAKWLTGLWLLVSIIVTFFYEGDYVEKMTVPFPTQGVDTFEKMFQENFTILTPHPKEDSMRLRVTANVLHIALKMPSLLPLIGV